MLQPAHVGHLALLRSLIRQGAAEGSFDRELARRFAGRRGILRQAEARARHRLFRRGCRDGQARDRRGPRLRVLAGRPAQRHAAGRLRPVSRDRRPAGYELWLAGLDMTARGGGQGRALLASLFATPPGQKTYVVRVQRDSRYVNDLQHLLAEFGFAAIGDTAAVALVPARRRAAGTRVARARQRRRAHRAKLTGIILHCRTAVRVVRRFGHVRFARQCIECARRRAGALRHGARHRILPQRMLRHRSRRHGHAHRVRRDDRGIPGVLQAPGQRPVHTAAGRGFSRASRRAIAGACASAAGARRWPPASRRR